MSTVGLSVPLSRDLGVVSMNPQTALRPLHNGIGGTVKLRKISFFTHEIEDIEKELRRAHCLLDRLSGRAGTAAWELSDCGQDTFEKVSREAAETLYEIEHVLSLLSESLENRESRIWKVRQDAATQLAA